MTLFFIEPPIDKWVIQFYTLTSTTFHVANSAELGGYCGADDEARSRKKHSPWKGDVLPIELRPHKSQFLTKEYY